MIRRNLGFITFLAFLVLMPVCTSGQVRLSGTVTEILDGQTVTITDLRGNTWAVRLRAIETPDEGQLLSELVKEHITKLLLSKQVTFRFSSMGEGEFVALVDIDGRDASQQMIRDGAAWFYADELGGASPDDVEIYQNLERLAKKESRGVWGESELIRPSEVRRVAHKVRDPLTDIETANIARVALGAAVESVFGPETFSLETTDCSGRVVGVADGDTVTILSGSNRTIKIRLQGIDAPEKSQGCGMASKQHLSGLIFGKYVSCNSTKKDRYGRVIGKLSIGGVDINRQMLIDGHAYHYKAYQNEQTAADRVSYATAEISSRRMGIGLWKNCGAVAPWDYRRDRFLASYTNYGNNYSGTYFRGVQGSSSGPIGGPVRVRGYWRGGTYVQPHTRRAPKH